MKSRQPNNTSVEDNERKLVFGVGGWKTKLAIGASALAGIGFFSMPEAALAGKQAAARIEVAEADKPIPKLTPSQAKELADYNKWFKERTEFLRKIYTSKEPNIFSGGLRIDNPERIRLPYHTVFNKTGQGVDTITQGGDGLTSIIKYPHYVVIGQHGYLVVRRSDILGTNVDPDYIKMTPDDVASTEFLDVKKLRELEDAGSIKVSWLAPSDKPPTLIASTIVDGHVEMKTSYGGGGYYELDQHAGSIDPQDVPQYLQDNDLQYTPPLWAPPFWAKNAKAK